MLHFAEVSTDGKEQVQKRFQVSLEEWEKRGIQLHLQEVDWFASDWSRRLEKFSNRYWTIGEGAPDAFSQRWDQDAGYFHPPLPELARELETVETEGARGAILVPDWPGSETDSIMIQAGGMVELMGVRGVVFESPEWIFSSTIARVSRSIEEGGDRGCPGGHLGA